LVCERALRKLAKKNQGHTTRA